LTEIYTNEWIDSNWIETWSGLKFHPFNPKVEEIKLEDIAHALSLTCRYNGHCSTFYSVAQHCIHTSLELEKQGHPSIIQLYGLLHDASEAYISDLTKPVKQCILQYKSIEAKIESVVWEAFGLNKPNTYEKVCVKNMDNMMLAYEANILMKNYDSWNDFHLTIINPEINFAESMIETERKFIELANKLLKEVNG